MDFSGVFEKFEPWRMLKKNKLVRPFRKILFEIYNSVINYSPHIFCSSVYFGWAIISASTNLRLIKFNSSIFFSNDSSSFTRFSKDKKADIDKFSSFLNFGKTSDCNVETRYGSASSSRILIFNFLTFFAFLRMTLMSHLSPARGFSLPYSVQNGSFYFWRNHIHLNSTIKI